MPFCFAKVAMPDLTKQTRQGLWDLRDRTDRRRLYEILGTPEQIFRWVDGALLVDTWRELEIPRAVRTSWDPVVQAGVYGPMERASE